jgi:hypothetical protein
MGGIRVMILLVSEAFPSSLFVLQAVSNSAYAEHVPPDLVPEMADVRAYAEYVLHHPVLGVADVRAYAGHVPFHSLFGIVVVQEEVVTCCSAYAEKEAGEQVRR